LLMRPPMDITISAVENSKAETKRAFETTSPFY
jgi:hypothetical protein